MKNKAVVLFFSLIFLSQTPIFAADLAAPGTPVRKLQRGFLNAMLSPFEFANELHREKKNDTFPPSWVVGLGRGICYTVGRALVGVGEVVTFPISAPANYGPILQPEFPWQHVPDKPAKKV